MIRFLHISDTHLGPDKEFVQHDVNTFEAFLHFLTTVKTLPFKPAFIIHTGDITADCFEEGYKLMASEVENLGIPMYFVTGNHDRSEQIKKHLSLNNVEELSSNLNSYRFSVGGHHFMTLDGRGPDAIDPHGVVSDEQMSLVKKELDSGKSLTFFIHYPALPLDSIWFDKNMLLTNGQNLHQLLVRYKTQVRGVFFGHIHRSTQIFQDGILYASVGSIAGQFILHPGQTEPLFEKSGRGSYNMVTVGQHSLIIKECSFEHSE